MITLPIAYLLWTDLTGRGQDLGTLAVAVDFAFAGLAGGLVVGLLLTPRGNRFHGFATLSIVLIDAFMLLLTM